MVGRSDSNSKDKNDLHIITSKAGSIDNVSVAVLGDFNKTQENQDDNNALYDININSPISRTNVDSSRSSSTPIFAKILPSSLKTGGQIRKFRNLDEQEVDDNHEGEIENLMLLNEKKKEKKLLFAILFSSVGNLLEWYDYSLFAAFTYYIGQNFFPPASEKTELLRSFLVFASAFFFRPVGGVLCGYIGDKFSKEKAILFSLALMAVSTTVMGLLPSYTKIGGWSTCILIFLRIMQGLAAGGQLTGTMVHVNDHCPEQKKGFYGGLVFGTASLGTLSGSLVAALMKSIMDTEKLSSYGWRLPFLFGSLVGVLGYIVHKFAPPPSNDHSASNPSSNDRLSEKGLELGELHPNGGPENYSSSLPAVISSESLQSSSDLPLQNFRNDTLSSHDGNFKSTISPKAKRQGIPFCEIFHHHKYELLLATLVAAGDATTYYCLFIWLQIYMQYEYHDSSKLNVFLINSIWLGSTILLKPVGGWLGDRCGFTTIMKCGVFLLIFTVPFTFYVVQNGGKTGVWLAQAISLLPFTFASGSLPAFLTNFSSDPTVSYTFTALAYNLAMSFFGGPTPAIVEKYNYLWNDKGGALWLMIMNLTAFVALLFVDRLIRHRKKKQDELQNIHANGIH